MTEIDWPNRTTAELLEELADREQMLRGRYDAYDAQLRRSPGSWSLADRLQQIHELGGAIQELRLAIAERYVEELEADQKFMVSARLRLDMLSIPDIEAHFAQASQYLRAREFHLAVSVLNTVVRHNPQLAESYFNRGLAFAQGGRFPRAILDFSAALRLKPDFAEAWLNRGMAYNDLQHYAEAIADLTEAIDLSPFNSEAYRERGLALKQVGRHDEAVVDLRRAAVQKKLEDLRQN